MVRWATLSALEALEQEMAREGRTQDEEALRDALQALGRPESGFLTTGQAARQLGVSIPTVKRWIERGVLAGGLIGVRWLVATESVEHLRRLRESLLSLDREGNPTPEEIAALSRRAHGPSVDRHDASA